MLIIPIVWMHHATASIVNNLEQHKHITLHKSHSPCLIREAAAPMRESFEFRSSKTVPVDILALPCCYTK